MYKRALSILGAVAATSVWVQGASITIVPDTTFANYTFYSISDGTVAGAPDVYITPGVTTVADWAAFGAQTGAAPTDVAHKNGGTANLALAGTYYSDMTSGRLKLDWSGGDPTASGPASFHDDAYKSISQQFVGSGQEVFTTKLIASDETIVLYTYVSDGTIALTASMPGASALPLTGQTNGATQGYGRVFLNITGGTVDDVVTFASTVEPPVSTYGCTAIIAASVVTAVPEPASLAVLGLGAMLVVRRRSNRAT